MLDLNKYSGKDRSEIFHSSGHAQLGRGGQIGSTGSQTFSQRIDIVNQHGKTVQGYHASKVGAQRGRIQARRYVPGGATDITAPQRGSRQAFNAGDRTSGANEPSGGRPPMKFQEPPSRGYDPYA